MVNEQPRPRRTIACPKHSGCQEYDLWRKQASSDVWGVAFCDLVRKWRPDGLGRGDGPDQERRRAFP